MIEVVSVCKNFGPRYAVQNISFNVHNGRILGLLGPNGAGKSTILKMMMNIIKPDSGRILFNGTRIREEDKDRIGYLPEERGLYRSVKIREMLEFLSSLKNGDLKKTTIALNELLERFDLMKCRNSTIETLSKGMSQKVQFIAAILHDPDFIFLDEPFSGLDPLSADMIKESVVELASRGKSIILSTHNMEVAEKICSDIVIMNHGMSVASGSLADIKQGCGKKTLVVEFDGTPDFSHLAKLIYSITTFPRFLEIELNDDCDPQEILKNLVDQVAIRRFEIITPSLHKVYMDSVGGV